MSIDILIERSKKFKPAMNQRELFITQCEYSDKNWYFRISDKAYKEIRKDFPGASPELAFWLYLDSQPNHNMVPMTREIYEGEIGLSRQTYRRAFNSLLDAGYIRYISDEKDGGSYYIFIEDGGHEAKALSDNGITEEDLKNITMDKDGGLKYQTKGCTKTDLGPNQTKVQNGTRVVPNQTQGLVQNGTRVVPNSYNPLNSTQSTNNTSITNITKALSNINIDSWKHSCDFGSTNERMYYTLAGTHDVPGYVEEIPYADKYGVGRDRVFKDNVASHLSSSDEGWRKIAKLMLHLDDAGRNPSEWMEYIKVAKEKIAINGNFCYGDEGADKWWKEAINRIS